MVFTPVPAAAGLNMPLLTPGPLYVPPAGELPVRAKAAASIQTDALDGQLTKGSAFTVMVNVQEPVQPVAVLV